MTFENELRLDLSGKDIKNIYAKQGDFEARKLRITLIKDELEFTIPEGVNAKIAWNKPDGNQVLNDCEIEDNKVVVVMTQQMLIKEGEADCEVMLFSQNELLSSAVFKTTIMPSAYDEDKIESSPEYNTFTNAIANLKGITDEAIEAVEEATGAVSEATEAVKVATKAASEATQIVQTIEADEESRKSAENTRQSNETKRQSAETARVNAENTRVSNETNRINEWTQKSSNIDTAITNANNATTGATNAATSANQAATLANQKATLAQTAASSATDAAASANQAKTNANEAATSANEAATSAQSSKTAADQAAQRANDAAESIEGLDVSALLEQIGSLEQEVDNFPSNYVKTTTKINQKPLTSDITLTANDVNASPVDHASTSTSYGVATTSKYGHVKYGTTSGTACQGNDNRLIPSGTIFSYGGSSAPNGYILCDGRAVSRTTYSELYGVIGTRYGSGDGSTTFNIPDLSGKIAVGYKSGDGTFGNIGASVGDKEEELIAQIGAYNGTLNNIGYCALNANEMSGLNYYDGAGIKNGEWANEAKTPYMVTKVSNKTGDRPTTIQPSLVVNYIIKY